jgi:hypothetical protein
MNGAKRKQTNNGKGATAKGRDGIEAGRHCSAEERI